MSIPFLHNRNKSYVGGSLVLSTLAFVLSLPGTVVYAQDIGKISGLVEDLQTIIDDLVGILIILAFLVFIWQLVKYIGNAEKKGGEGLAGLGLSVLALVVLVSLWGVIAFVQELVGIDPEAEAPSSFELPGVSRDETLGT